MLVLAIDTATAATSVAVLEGAPGGQLRVRAQRRQVDPRGHGEQLAPQIGAVLSELGVGPGALAAIVAGTGPGPFTGLRVGLVTAAAMGQTLAIPTYGVCSLDGIGATAPGVALVATDARRKEVYWAIYADGQRRTEPAVDRPVDLLSALAAHGVGQAYGEGARRYATELPVAVAPTYEYPDPLVLAQLAVERVYRGAESELLTPRYLRRPDAALPKSPKPVTPL